MCLTVPCEVMRVTGETALVRRGDAQFEVSLIFVDEAVAPGDWVAVQAQRHAQGKLSAEQAHDVLALLAEISELVAHDSGAMHA